MPQNRIAMMPATAKINEISVQLYTFVTPYIRSSLDIQGIQFTVNPNIQLTYWLCVNNSHSSNIAHSVKGLVTHTNKTFEQFSFKSMNSGSKSLLINMK